MLHKFTCCPCTGALLISVSFKFLVYVLEASTTLLLFNIFILPQASTVSSKTFSDPRVAELEQGSITQMSLRILQALGLAITLLE